MLLEKAHQAYQDQKKQDIGRSNVVDNRQIEQLQQQEKQRILQEQQLQEQQLLQQQQQQQQQQEQQQQQQQQEKHEQKQKQQEQQLQEQQLQEQQQQQQQQQGVTEGTLFKKKPPLDHKLLNWRLRNLQKKITPTPKMQVIHDEPVKQVPVYQTLFHHRPDPGHVNVNLEDSTNNKLSLYKTRIIGLFAYHVNMIYIY